MQRTHRMMMGLLVLVPACEQVKRIDDGGGACVPAEVQAAFDRSCGGASCHTDGGMSGGLALGGGQAAAAIGRAAIGSPMPLIELGNTSGSYLAQKIISDPTSAITGDRMPLGFAASNENQVADVNTILTWIGGGEFGACAADTGDSSGMADTAGTDESTGGPPTQSCALDALAPGAPNPIVSGAAALQIPPDIAVILAGNCGCHYANNLMPLPPYLDYNEETQPLDIATWAGFQATNPADVAYHAVTLSRVMGEGGQFPMPPTGCDVIPTAEFDTLVAWLTAGAPDGATWTGGGETIQACGIEDIKPGAPNPIVSGDGAMQIPTDIGTILASNCGCHFVDEPTAPVTDYSGAADLSTWAGFQAPIGVDPMPLHMLALGYVDTEFMPLSASCNIGGDLAMPAIDRALLVQWLTEGAPDGATWVP